MFIEPLEESKYPWAIRKIFDFQKKRYSQVLTPMKLWARIPKVFFAFISFWKILDRTNSPLENDLRVLVNVFVSKINGCAFCVDFNSLEYLKRGGIQEKLDDLDNLESTDIYTGKEKAALLYAKAATLKEKPPKDLIKKYFSEDEIIELTALIAFEIASNSFNTTLEIPSDNLLKN